MRDPADHLLFLKGIDEFNHGQFFRCHETWEELWIRESGPARLFYKGLIQAAVALFHLHNGNRHGAEKLLAGATGYLSPYRPEYLGLNVDKFLDGLSGCITGALAANGGVCRPGVHPKETPRIDLNRRATPFAI